MNVFAVRGIAWYFLFLSRYQMKDSNICCINRFVRFVSTPEILERVHTIESEILQLEEAIALQSSNDNGHSVVKHCNNFFFVLNQHQFYDFSINVLCTFNR